MRFFVKPKRKKICSVCGQKLSGFGCRKLSDGVLCKDCESGLSRWFTVSDSDSSARVREHLAYRRQNRGSADSFEPTRAIGLSCKLLLDDAGGRFLIAEGNNWREENPDVLSLADVKACRTEIIEKRTELKRRDWDGNEYSYDPKRFTLRYDFYVEVSVEHPWFEKMRFKLNSSPVEGLESREYLRYQSLADEVTESLTIDKCDVRTEQEEVKIPVRKNAALENPLSD